LLVFVIPALLFIALLNDARKCLVMDACIYTW
jgi:hypothetical protein